MADLSSLIPESVDTAVKNISDKPTQAIGQTISDLWNLVLGGRVAYAAEKQKIKYAHSLEQYRHELESKISSIPSDKLETPRLQVVAQALEDSQYCIEEEELRNMFSNLISRSMDHDYSEAVHPSFSKIIQQMSALDAKMLQIFCNPSHPNGLAVADFMEYESRNACYPLCNSIPALIPYGYTHEQAAKSLSSLCRLGLIQIPEDLYFEDARAYARFQCLPLYKQYSMLCRSRGNDIKIEKRIARLTLLGEDFVNVCLRRQP